MADGGTGDWILAIDFGTSNTTAAMASGDGSEATVLEVENSRYLPSVVFRDDQGQILTGRSAAQRAVVAPERAERVPKRALVAGDQVILGGSPVPVTELVAAVLRRIYTEAVRFHGGRPPARTLLTCPAQWTSVQRGKLVAAAQAAGISDADLVEEPVAAAWHHAPPAGGHTVAVFDFGGGTLDTAVLRSTGAGYELAGPPGGDANLGGEDFDELLLGKIGDLARDRDAEAWAEFYEGSGRVALRGRALLRGDVRMAKESLSQELVALLAVAGYPEEFRVTRAEFDDLTSEQVAQGVAKLGETITAAGLAPGELDAIYLTGGTSRVPAIAAAVAAATGKVPELHADPKAVVALGALSYAAANLKKEKVLPPRRRRWPVLVGAGSLILAAVLGISLTAFHHPSGGGGGGGGNNYVPATDPVTYVPAPDPVTTTPDYTTPPPGPTPQQQLDALIPSSLSCSDDASQIQGAEAMTTCQSTDTGYKLTYALFPNTGYLQPVFDNDLQSNSTCPDLVTWAAPCATSYQQNSLGKQGEMAEVNTGGSYQIICADTTDDVLITMSSPANPGGMLAWWLVGTDWIVPSS